MVLFLIVSFFLVVSEVRSQSMGGGGVVRDIEGSVGIWVFFYEFQIVEKFNKFREDEVFIDISILRKQGLNLDKFNQ